MKQIERLEVNDVFCFVIFFFDQSKNTAILEPRNEHIWVLVGFEAKAKKGRFWGQGRPRGLNLGRPKCDIITCKIKIL